MVAFLTALLQTLRSWFVRRARLEAENLLLRQQLLVLRRKQRGRLRLRNLDRLLLVWFYRLFPTLLDAILVVRPETVIRWHRWGLCAYWRWRSRKPGGRPGVDRELRALIRRMSRENPLWGAPRIHGELQMLGFEVAESTVGKYMVRRRQPPHQGWKTFLRNHAAGIASLDLFVVRTISFKLLYGLVILRHARRLLVTVSVTTKPAAQWIAGQVTDAFPWDEAPHHLLRDRDHAFGWAYTRRVRGMGIRDHPVAARSPWQNGHVERVIGSIRRECLDHVIVFDETHLRRVLKTYAAYYNGIRTHLALGKDAPSFRRRQHHGKVVAVPILNGLHHNIFASELFGRDNTSVDSIATCVQAASRSQSASTSSFRVMVGKLRTSLTTLLPTPTNRRRTVGGARFDAARFSASLLAVDACPDRSS